MNASNKNNDHCYCYLLEAATIECRNRTDMANHNWHNSYHCITVDFNISLKARV